MGVQGNVGENGGWEPGCLPVDLTGVPFDRVGARTYRNPVPSKQRLYGDRNDLHEPSRQPGCLSGSCCARPGCSSCAAKRCAGCGPDSGRRARRSDGDGASPSVAAERPPPPDCATPRRTRARKAGNRGNAAPGDGPWPATLIASPYFTPSFATTSATGLTSIAKSHYACLNVEAVFRDPFAGVGKPEPLKHVLAGCWSRRITQEHRLVYRVAEDRVDFLQARYHY